MMPLCRTALYWLATCHRRVGQPDEAAELERQAASAATHPGGCPCLEAARRDADAIAYRVGQQAASRAGRRDPTTAILFNAMAAEQARQKLILEDLVIPGLDVLRPEWITADVGRLARAIHQDRLLGADLGVLADALEEAGCTGWHVLGHLRGPGPHHHGCWVIGLVLHAALSYAPAHPAD